MNNLKAKLEEMTASKQKAMNEWDTEIAEIKGEIKGGDKPKLRHGDYGFGTNWKEDDKDAFVYVDQTSEKKAFYASGMGQVDVNHAKHTVAGNIFDDLAATGPMAEEVREFEVETDINSGLISIGLSAEPDHLIYFSVEQTSTGMIHVKLEKAEKIHYKLGLLIRTLEQDRRGE